jgi:hypothetical protein
MLSAVNITMLGIRGAIVLAAAATVMGDSLIVHRRIGRW